ncbi:MAG TPA: 3-isopropylmalate dehydratase small subunit [Hyphomicrobiales bacterium]|nr:3-isopropylmalate dehydratase small subunit [Hyphomicrobiales bacterium]
MSILKNKLGGACMKMGDNVNSDVIIPGRYLVSIDPQELAKHAFEPLGDDFQRKLQKTKILVAGRNFGCGSAREQAASCLIGAGVQAIIADSFARVFFRNAINTGLVAIQCPEAVAAVESGDDLYVDMKAGEIQTPKGNFTFPSYPESTMSILESGGLIPYVAVQLLKEGK